MGLFDHLAKVFKHIATYLSEMPEDQVQQIIDDVACGSKTQVEAFYWKYREVASDCGVKVAPEDDPKKAFSASRTREVFGVNYCSLTFTWWLRDDRLGIVVDMLQKVEKTDHHILSFLKGIGAPRETSLGTDYPATGGQVRRGPQQFSDSP